MATGKNNQLKAGVVLTYAQTILNAVISIAYTPIMLRLLGQSEYGVYTMSSSMIAYLGLLNFGLNSSYVRFYTRYRNKQDNRGLAQLNGMFLVVYSAIALIALSAGLVLSANIEILYGASLTAKELDITRILLIILSFNLSMTFISTVFSSYVTANEQFVFQKLLNMGKTVLSPLATIPVLLFGFRSIGMTITTTAICLLVDIANVVFSLKKLNMRFTLKGADFRLMKEVTAYSSLIAVNSLVDQINWQVDKVILGHYYGSAETAVYGVASQINTLYIGVSSAISSVFTPRVHKLVYSDTCNESYNRLFVKIGRLQMLVLGLVGSGFVLFGRPFISFWAGEGYESAYAISLLLLLPGTVPLVQNIGIEIQRAKNMHSFRSAMYFLMAVFNVALSIPLGCRYGGVGCALGTAISLVLANGLAMNWFYARRMELQISRFWRKISPILFCTLASFGISYALLSFVDLGTLPVFGACVLGYCAVYFVISWLFAMNSDEKSLLTTLVRKVLRR